jgi:hypothetical protein
MGSLRTIQRESRIISLALNKPQHWYRDGYGLLDADADRKWFWFYTYNPDYLSWYSFECLYLRFVMGLPYYSWTTYSWTTYTVTYNVSPVSSSSKGSWDEDELLEDVEIDFFFTWRERKEKENPIVIINQINPINRGPPNCECNIKVMIFIVMKGC